jgi:hypothetical protein
MDSYISNKKTYILWMVKKNFAGKGDVTTPPEIIPYYHRNHSIWSLSDNKEVSR